MNRERAFSNPFVLTVAILLAAGPLARGLFFPPEQLVVASALFAVGILWALDRYRQGRPPIRTLSLLEVGALLVPATYAVSAIHAVYARGALLGLVAAAASYAVFVISRDARAGGTRGRLLSAAMVVGAALVAALGLASYLQVSRLPGAVVLGWRMAADLGRVGSTFQYPNTLAAFLGVGMLLSMGLQDPDAPAWRGAGWRAAAGLMAVVLVLTQSRGAILLLPVAALFLVMLAPGGRRVQILVEFGGVAAGALLTVGPIVRASAAAQPWVGVMWAVAAALVAAGPWGAIVARARRYGPWTQPVIALAAAGLVVAVFVNGHVAEVPAAARLNRSMTAAAGALDEDTPLPSDQISRLYLVRDAAAILRDYPFLGAGAGGWAVLFPGYRTSPYYSTQVHSFYAQYAVETGSLGLLALLTFLAGLAVTSARILRVRRGGVERMQMAGALAALTMLLLHSAVDFDLSYLSLSLVVWALAGSIQGEARRLAPDEWEGDTAAAERRLLTGVSRQGQRAARVAEEMAAGAGAPRRASWSAVALISGFLVMGLLTVPLLGGEAFKYWAGVRRDSGRTDSAIRNYSRALRFNPKDDEVYLALSGLYLKQWANARATAPADGQNQQQILDRAIGAAEHALTVNPDSTQVRATLAQQYLDAHLDKSALEQALLLQQQDPWGIEGYSIAAQVQVRQGLADLSAGNTPAARKAFGAVLEDGLRVRQLADEFNSRAVKVGRAPRISGRLALALGQAHYFLRNTKEAEKYFNLARADMAVAPEAQPWLALLYRATGPRGKDGWWQRQPWVRQAFQDEEFLKIAALPQL